MCVCRAAPYGTSRENCELSDRDTRDLDLNNPNFYDDVPDYDFYERSAFGRNGQDCLDGRVLLFQFISTRM